jgi:hypothetical protein
MSLTGPQPNRIGTEELVSLIASDLHRLAPEASAAARLAVADLRERAVVAEDTSPDSQWLRDLIATSQDLLTDDAVEKLGAVHILSVDSFHINALARRVGNTPQIIIFSGLRHLVHFFADYVTVLAHLLRLRPDAMIERPSDRSRGKADDPARDTDPDRGEAFLFSAACFAIIADFLRNGRPPSLIHDLLGPAARKNVELGYRTAILFALLHELGHIDLGHLEDGPLSEVLPIALVEPETLSLYQQDELAADAYAIAHIAPAHRADIISSVMFLLGSFALLEAFMGGFSVSHPLTINRLGAIADAAGLTADDRVIVEGWIEDRARAFRSFAGDRTSAGGSIVERIDSAIPITEAYAILAEIKRRIKADLGELEQSASAPP